MHPSTWSQIIALPFGIPALLIIAFCVPLIFGLVPRNRAYGIRTCKTLSDDRIWYPANRFGAVALVLGAVVYLKLALSHGNPLGPSQDVHWQVQALVGPLAIAVFVTLVYIRRL